MKLAEAFKRVNKEAWKDAFSWLALNVLAFASPIVIAYFLSLVSTGEFNFLDPIQRSELLIISISFLITGLFTLIRGLKVIDFFEKLPFPGSSLFLIAIIFEYTISLALFISAFQINRNIKNYLMIENTVIIISLIILIFSLLTTFVITLIDSAISNNIPSYDDLNRSRTNNDLNNLRDGLRSS
jgi:hypothetical protein